MTTCSPSPRAMSSSSSQGLPLRSDRALCKAHPQSSKSPRISCFSPSAASRNSITSCALPLVASSAKCRDPVGRIVGTTRVSDPTGIVRHTNKGVIIVYTLVATRCLTSAHENLRSISCTTKFLPISRFQEWMAGAPQNERESQVKFLRENIGYRNKRDDNSYQCREPTTTWLVALAPRLLNSFKFSTNLIFVHSYVRTYLTIL